MGVMIIQVITHLSDTDMRLTVMRLMAMRLTAMTLTGMRLTGMRHLNMGRKPKVQQVFCTFVQLLPFFFF